MRFLEGFCRAAIPGKNEVIVIVLTISHDHAKTRELLKLGANCVLHKPLDINDLKKCLQNPSYEFMHAELKDCNILQFHYSNLNP